MTRCAQALVLLTAFAIAGCGGGGGGSEPVVAQPAPPDGIATLESALAEFPVDNYAIIIGDADGPLLTFESGSFSLTEQQPIASGSKWLTAMVLLDLVERGIMSLDDAPQDYLDWWADDERSQITLEMLLSFTAGFDASPGDSGCFDVALTTLDLCVREIHDQGLAYTPGTTFHYGPSPMQVAARMAEVASGMRYSDLVESVLAAPLELTATDFRIPSAANPRASGGGRSSARDYARILQAILDGRFLAAANDDMVTDRTGPPVIVASIPPAARIDNSDSRYALGNWRECPQAMWDTSCDSRRIASSTGAFGWHPWIDYDNGYYGVIAVTELSIDGESPSGASIRFFRQIQPLIIDALTDLRAQR